MSGKTGITGAEWLGSTLVLTLAGRLDSQTTPVCEAELGEHLARDPKRLVLDLEGLDYVASTGLRLLLLAAKRLKLKGGELRVCGLQANVQEVFEISGFNGLIPVFDTRPQAVSAGDDGPAAGSQNSSL